MDMMHTIHYEEGDYQVEHEYILEVALEAFAKRFDIKLDNVKNLYNNDWLDFYVLIEEFDEEIKNHFRKEYLAELRG